MISFTVKGKNFDPRAKYWWPAVYYYENSQMKYAKATDALNPIPISQTTVHFNNVPSNSGFAASFYTSPNIEDIITDPYMAASTDLFVLKDGGRYSLDFHNEVAIPTLFEEEAPAADFIQNLWPWPPWAGPPLPRFFPPWPWWEWETGIPEFF